MTTRSSKAHRPGRTETDQPLRSPARRSWSTSTLRPVRHIPHTPRGRSARRCPDPPSTGPGRPERRSPPRRSAGPGAPGSWWPTPGPTCETAPALCSTLIPSSLLLLGKVIPPHLLTRRLPPPSRHQYPGSRSPSPSGLPQYVHRAEADAAYTLPDCCSTSTGCPPISLIPQWGEACPPPSPAPPPADPP